ncbi:tyrosine-type recombinase/integrase [Streptomyces sp. S3(2020)]|uniref:tyrosine-type recombinase/integrase n=1 Tax=Streptomyces sp. S3(2020) TaxID=2732044 RepID=UPI0014891F45|nr:tyrosine-type recombinase/integrase [Streptomyces sp. S3(2020)]NNN32048.1 tyrosine-type recombinase/integrase [Streptomyces sp. S3(2020)]
MAAVVSEGTFHLSDRQSFAILDWAAERPQSGLVLRAFLASIALAALRPGEALALRVRDVEIAEDGATWLLVHPQAQERREKDSDRAGAVRRVPVCRALAAILKEETIRRDLHPDDAIFVLDDGRPLTAEVYRKVWRQARAAVLQAHELDSPLGRHVSALRDARIAAWLKNGDQTAAHTLAVAECAGMSAPRLAERFAYCFRKPTRTEIPWDRLEAALALPDLPSQPTPIARRP